MRSELRTILALLLASGSTGLVGGEPVFELGFLAPAAIEGAPGSRVMFTFDCTLTSSTGETISGQGSAAETAGAQGWSFSALVRGAVVKEVAIRGLVVHTLLDVEADDPDDRLVPTDLDLADAGFKIAQPGTGSYPGSPIFGLDGALSAVILHQTRRMVLPSTGTQTIARVTAEAVVPEQGCLIVELSYRDGLRGLGQPVKNVVTVDGESIVPSRGTASVQVCAPVPRFQFAAVPEGIPTTRTDEGHLLAAPVVSFFEGETGSLELEVRVVLDSDAKAVQGPQGWSLGLASGDCLEVISVTTSGLVVDTLFDEDGVPSTPMVARPLDLGDAEFRVAQTATGDYPDSPAAGMRGVVSAVVLNQTRVRVLPGTSLSQVLRVRYRYTAPILEGEVNPECTIRFVSGLKGQGQPVKNVVTINGRSRIPYLQSLVLKPIGVVVRTGAFRRGNANDDDKVDVSDAVWIVQAVVPALNGSPIACAAAGDVNDDGRVDLVDAISLIDYLFRTGLRPPAPFSACGTDRDSPLPCPPGSSTSCGIQQ